MSELNASNDEIIAEFRANRGKVGGFYARESLLLLTTIGRKSGKQYTTPLSFIKDGDRLIVIGANIGSSKLADWFLNLVANPRVTVEVGDQRSQAVATMLSGHDRERLLEIMRRDWDASRALSPELPEMPIPEGGEIPVVAIILPSVDSHQG
ncbi:MAG: nitroreductase/quinone reductase family protein [Chloroflexota bacterium]